MEKTLPKLQYRVSPEISRTVPVIVVAAGSSTRMNGVNKQLAMLDGKPVLIRTLTAFDESPFISRIILVTREEDILTVQRLCDEYAIRKLTDVVAGGINRHESVMNGFFRLTPQEEKVLIHDGARPLVSARVIADVVTELETQQAVVCANPIVDTVKRADQNGMVCETVDRTGLYAIQTPQGMTVSSYLKAVGQVADAAMLTDDAALMERAGISVKIVAGSPYNIKITAPGDLLLAEIYLKGTGL